jgi:hypothetical protein
MMSDFPNRKKISRETSYHILSAADRHLIRFNFASRKARYVEFDQLIFFVFSRRRSTSGISGSMRAESRGADRVTARVTNGAADYKSGWDRAVIGLSAMRRAGGAPKAPSP